MAAIALADVAEDIRRGQALRGQKVARDAATHRFTVLHDIASGNSAPSLAISHYDLGVYARLAIETLQLARSAILYLAEFIALREAHLHAKTGLTLPLLAPPHHEIRGEDASGREKGRREL